MTGRWDASDGVVVLKSQVGALQAEGTSAKALRWEGKPCHTPALEGAVEGSSGSSVDGGLLQPVAPVHFLPKSSLQKVHFHAIL